MPASKSRKVTFAGMGSNCFTRCQLIPLLIFASNIIDEGRIRTVIKSVV